MLIAPLTHVSQVQVIPLQVCHRGGSSVSTFDQERVPMYVHSDSISSNLWSLCLLAVLLVASYPGHVGGGKSGLVSTVCACAKTPMISWGIVYHRSQTINLYHIAPKHIRLELIQHTAGKSEDFDKALFLKFALCCIGKGDFTLKAE